MSAGKDQHDVPHNVGAEDAAVKQQNRQLGGRDAGDVDNDKGVGRLVQLGKLFVRHHPEMLASAPRHTDETAHARSDAHDLYFLTHFMISFCFLSVCLSQSKNLKNT